MKPKAVTMSMTTSIGNTFVITEGYLDRKHGGERGTTL